MAVVVALVLPMPALSARVTRYADALGDAVALDLADLLLPLRVAITPDRLVEIQTELSGAPIEPPEPSAARVELGTRVTTPRPKARPARGIRISSAQVLALAARRAMPRAVPVQAAANHPAGLRLQGVSGLGVGLQDGDVLTEAAGQRASSLAAVVGIVLSARAHHSREISGQFFRAGVFYSITVEQPYPPLDVKG